MLLSLGEGGRCQLKQTGPQRVLKLMANIRSAAAPPAAGLLQQLLLLLLAGCCWHQAGWILLLSVWLVRTVRNSTLYSYRCSGGSCVIDTIHRALVYNMKYSRKLIGLVMIGRSINDIVH
jgi:hypothetical protein